MPALHPAPGRRPLVSGPLRDDALDAVHGIAAELRARVHTPAAAPDGGRRAGPSLASGDAGVALFLGYLDGAFPGQGYGEDAAILLDRIAGAVASQALTWDLYAGFTGIAWVIAHLRNAGFAPAAEFELDEIDEVVARIVSQRPWREDYDLVSGLVGYSVYALERLPSPAAVRIATAIVDRLAELAVQGAAGITWHTPQHLVPSIQRDRHPHGWYNLGVAHGVPGIVAFLAQAVAAGVRHPRAPELLRGGVEWILAQRLPPAGASAFPNWVAPGAPPLPARSAWCYGDPGVGAALLLAGTAAGEAGWAGAGREILVRAGARPYDHTGVVDASLCHGAAGLAHIYARAARATGDGALLHAAGEWYRRTLGMRRPGEGVGGFAYRTWSNGGPVWTAEPGFLEGSAGIGLALLAAVTGVEPAWDRSLLTNIAAAEPGSPPGTPPSGA